MSCSTTGRLACDPYGVRDKERWHGGNGTLSCEVVKGASGAQILRISTRQQAAKALTPLSLWPRMLEEQRSFAILFKDSFCSHS